MQDSFDEFWHPPKIHTLVKNSMTSSTVIELLNLFKRHGIEIWIDGGWGVDALLGEQTRLHEDLDIVVQQKDIPKLRDLLTAKGYEKIPRDDTSSWNFVLGNDQGHAIDIHVIVFDSEGNGQYGPAKKGAMYPASSLTGIGTIEGYSVKCISAEDMVKFHTGYKLQESDYRDVLALCDRFNIDYPPEYTHLKK